MADNDTYEPRDALISLLRDCLDGEEFDAAVGLLDEVLANPGSTQATDRKLTADSFAWVMKEGRRNEVRSHAAREKNRLAPLPAGMAMDTAGLADHANAAKAVYTALKNKPRARAAMATDGATVTRRNAMFPNGN